RRLALNLHHPAALALEVAIRPPALHFGLREQRLQCSLVRGIEPPQLDIAVAHAPDDRIARRRKSGLLPLPAAAEHAPDAALRVSGPEAGSPLVGRRQVLRLLGADREGHSPFGGPGHLRRIGEAHYAVAGL